MAKFLTDLRATLIDDDRGDGQRAKWRLDAPLEYASDIDGVQKITVPAGTVTDFASVPRLPLMWVLAGGVGDRASVVHDWLYATHIYPRATCDAVFAEALAASCVGLFRRAAMWAAVRMAGWAAWRAVSNFS